ncbi:MAG: energy-coupling factor ABC transporter permease [Candidatus Magnetominusculus sp. LBB02]|nr:energy-coupling factor ABC transporter permease [Candidatus Magnetominusculus sp. LBB02]
MKKGLLIYMGIAAMFIVPQEAYAMHIMEGFLPFNWCAFWYACSLPFLIYGFAMLKKATKDNMKLKLLLGLCGAFVFVMSAMKIPSVMGSCSHPTGVGLGAIVFGPAVMAVLGGICLVFQALLLAHGGISTLGANVFSMAVVGPMVSYLIYNLFKRAQGPGWLSVFLAAALGDLATYIVTAFQLALAFPSRTGGAAGSFLKFLAVFAVTQVPIAVTEGILTVIVYNYLTANSAEELKMLAERGS